MRFRRVLPAVLFTAIVVAGAANAQTTTQAPALRSPDVIFVPTPPEVVEAMLKLAKVGPNDVVYDLGSGDGRIPIAAVQTFKARSAVGIDIDPQRIREANENLKKAGVGDRVRFLNQDLFTTPIGEASVVTLYLLQSLNEKLMPKLQKELKPGSRIVSQSFSMGEKWPPGPDDSGRGTQRLSLDHQVATAICAVLDDLDAEDVTGVRTLQALPSRVDAGIAADESSVVPLQPVRVARSGRKIDRHQKLTGLAVILVQAGFPLGVAGAVVAGHDPDVALVVERHVVKARPLLRAHADQDFGNPRLRIDTQDAAQAQRGNPELAVVPLHAMATTAAAVDAERNLTVADELGVHVDLKDAVWVGVRAHPHAAAPVRHAGACCAKGS